MDILPIHPEADPKTHHRRLAACFQAAYGADDA